MAKKKKANKNLPAVLDGKPKYEAEPSSDIVERLAEEMEAMLVTRTKEAREFTIRVFFEAGEMMRDAEKKNKVNITALVELLSSDNRIRERQMGERNLWMALKIYDWTEGDFEKVYKTEEGENISLTKLKKMLTTAMPKKDPTSQELARQIFDKFGQAKCKEIVKELERLIRGK